MRQIVALLALPVAIIIAVVYTIGSYAVSTPDYKTYWEPLKMIRDTLLFR